MSMRTVEMMAWLPKVGVNSIPHIPVACAGQPIGCHRRSCASGEPHGQQYAHPSSSPQAMLLQPCHRGAVTLG